MEATPEYRAQLKAARKNLKSQLAGATDATRIANLREALGNVEDKISLIKRERSEGPPEGYQGNTYAPRSGKRTADDESFTAYLRGKGPQQEYRSVLDSNALSTAPNSAGVSAGSTGYDGGYMIPQSFWALLAKAMKAYGGISSSYTLLETPTGAPMPWPTNDSTAIVGRYLTEMNQLGFGGDSNGTDYTFGQGMLNAWTIVSGVILASVQLLEDSAIDVDAFVAEKTGEAIGRKLALEAVSGTGSSACLGILTALSARGILTGQQGGVLGLTAATDVAIFGNYSSPSTTELAGNVLSPLSLVNMVKKVDQAYMSNAKWYMNPSLAWNMRTVTDANGRPILNFSNGLSADDVRNPNYNDASPVGSIFGFPVILDANIPVLTASTASGCVFGNLQKAMVMRVVRGDARIDSSAPTATGAGPSATMLTLDERYMDYLQRGYIAYLRADIRSNDLRAAVVAQPAAT